MGVTIERRGELRLLHSSLHRWEKGYDIIDAEKVGDGMLVYKEANASLEPYKQVQHYGTLFESLRSIHQLERDHKKSHTLYAVSQKRFGKSVPRWCAQAIGDTCPVCISRHMLRKQPTAGHQPILSRGFGSRGQLDLIDFQSMPDGKFRFLMVYRDHGIKICRLIPLRNKTAIGVAQKLIELFTFIGPPAILQTDNGGEFNYAAFNNKARKEFLSDGFVGDVITEVKRLWPGCLLLRGKPRHSESNGGVERLNFEVEKKLGNWLFETNSKSWSLGCNFV